MSLVVVGGALAALAYQVDKSMKNDAEALQKNAKAATRIAEADNKIRYSRQNLTNALTTNAKRKNGILTCHLKMFLEQCEIMNKLVFLKKGKGLEELEKITEIQNKFNCYVNLPAVSSGKIFTDSQLLVSFALRGIGGTMIKESEMNLQAASRNLSYANAYSSQSDSVCIAIDAITEHTKIITDLLQKLGMIYMKSIKNISNILTTNGNKEENYSDKDIEAINLSFIITKLVYRIINTPLVDDNGEIEKESLKVINDGHELLNSIG